MDKSYGDPREDDTSECQPGCRKLGKGPVSIVFAARKVRLPVNSRVAGYPPVPAQQVLEHTVRVRFEGGAELVFVREIAQPFAEHEASFALAETFRVLADEICEKIRREIRGECG